MDEAALRRLIRRGESIKLDFKACLALATRNAKAEFVRDVLCIVNPPGSVGHLLFGVDDQGNPTGQRQDAPSEEQMQQVIREYTEPYVETSYEIVSLGGVAVGVLTITRQPEKLPYRVAKPVGGEDKAIAKDDIFYRYGRHCMKAQYSDMLALIGEGERARRRLAALPATDASLDPWRFLSPSARREAMNRALERLLPASLIRTRQVAWIRRPALRALPTCALADISGERFLTFWYVWPEDLSRTTLWLARHGATRDVTRKGRSTLTTPSRMQFILSYGNVARSLLPRSPLVDAVLVTERFGIYLGPSVDHIVLAEAGGYTLPIPEPSLYVKNVKSEPLMAAAMQQCLDWLAQNSHRIPHLPFPLP